MPEPLSWEEFQALVAELLHVAPSQVTPEAAFITDLGVDSLRLVDILLKLEELGVEISPDLAWEIQTVGDAYRYTSAGLREAVAPPHLQLSGSGDPRVP
jgi:acyl carrier protein